MNHLKFRDHTMSEGKPVHWNRVELDGLPFRGDVIPMTEQEAEERVAEVIDFHNGFFDLRRADQNASYCNIMAGVMNGWYQLVHIDRSRLGTNGEVYVEWFQGFLEDKTPVPMLTRGGRNGPSCR